MFWLDSCENLHVSDDVFARGWTMKFRLNSWIMAKFSSFFLTLAVFNIGKNQNESMRYPVSNPYNLVYNMRDNSECLRVFPALWDFLFYSSCYQVQWSVILSLLRFRVEWNCEIHVMRFSHFLSFPFFPSSVFLHHHHRSESEISSPLLDGTTLSCVCMCQPLYQERNEI